VLLCYCLHRRDNIKGSLSVVIHRLYLHQLILPHLVQLDQTSPHSFSWPTDVHLLLYFPSWSSEFTPLFYCFVLLVSGWIGYTHLSYILFYTPPKGIGSLSLPFHLSHFCTMYKCFYSKFLTTIHRSSSSTNLVIIIFMNYIWLKNWKFVVSLFNF